MGGRARRSDAIGAAAPGAQLEQFLSKFAPDVRAEAKASLRTLRRLVPGAVQLVYDNYNGLVVGFCPSERASDAVLSLLFTARGVTLCFLQDGPSLADPSGLLRGSGHVVRHTRLASAALCSSGPSGPFSRRA